MESEECPAYSISKSRISSKDRSPILTLRKVNLQYSLPKKRSSKSKNDGKPRKDSDDNENSPEELKPSQERFLRRQMKKAQNLAGNPRDLFSAFALKLGLTFRQVDSWWHNQDIKSKNCTGENSAESDHTSSAPSASQREITDNPNEVTNSYYNESFEFVEYPTAREPSSSYSSIEIVLPSSPHSPNKDDRCEPLDLSSRPHIQYYTPAIVESQPNPAPIVPSNVEDNHQKSYCSYETPYEGNSLFTAITSAFRPVLQGTHSTQYRFVPSPGHMNQTGQSPLAVSVPPPGPIPETFVFPIPAQRRTLISASAAQAAHSPMAHHASVPHPNPQTGRIPLKEKFVSNPQPSSTIEHVPPPQTDQYAQPPKLSPQMVELFAQPRNSSSKKQRHIAQTCHPAPTEEQHFVEPPRLSPQTEQSSCLVEQGYLVQSTEPSCPVSQHYLVQPPPSLGPQTEQTFPVEQHHLVQPPILTAQTEHSYPMEQRYLVQPPLLRPETEHSYPLDQPHLVQPPPSLGSQTEQTFPMEQHYLVQQPILRPQTEHSYPIEHRYLVQRPLLRPQTEHLFTMDQRYLVQAPIHHHTGQSFPVEKHYLSQSPIWRPETEQSYPLDQRYLIQPHIFRPQTAPSRSSIEQGYYVQPASHQATAMEQDHFTPTTRSTLQTDNLYRVENRFIAPQTPRSTLRTVSQPKVKSTTLQHLVALPRPSVQVRGPGMHSALGGQNGPAFNISTHNEAYFRPIPSYPGMLQSFNSFSVPDYSPQLPKPVPGNPEWFKKHFTGEPVRAVRPNNLPGLISTSTGMLCPDPRNTQIKKEPMSF